MNAIANLTWARSSGVADVMAALTAAGGEPRFVGGCVRNALLNVPVSDIDVATILPPLSAMAALEKAGIKTVPTGLDHGTVTAIAHGQQVEVTTLRRDVATDGRRAVVAFTTDWAEDAQRRDFTINALYATPEGQVFDPAGQGFTDLKARRVRFIGDAGQRIREDYLRILRFFRIHALYGAGAFDGDGLRACADHVAGLAQLSGERIQKEMMRILSVEEPIPVMRAMASTGVLPAVIPGQLNLPRLARLAEMDRDTFADPDPVLRLTALLHEEAQAQSVAQRWRLSNRDADRVRALCAAAPPKIVPYLSIREVRRTLYKIGADRFVDFCRLRWAEDQKPSNQMNWRAMIAMAQCWVPPAMPLTGAQVVHAGVQPGPKVGLVLAEVEEWWIDADFTDDEFSIIERLKAVVQALP